MLNTYIHTDTYTCTHTHTLMHSHITDGDGRTGGKDVKYLWQELEENRRVLREDFKDWNSKNNLQAPC